MKESVAGGEGWNTGEYTQNGRDGIFLQGRDEILGKGRKKGITDDSNRYR